MEAFIFWMNGTQSLLFVAVFAINYLCLTGAKLRFLSGILTSLPKGVGDAMIADTSQSLAPARVSRQPEYMLPTLRCNIGNADNANRADFHGYFHFKSVFSASSVLSAFL